VFGRLDKLENELETIKQEMAAYKKLLGHPAIQASGTGSDSVEAQPPTGLFLVTHQQFLIQGAMQLADEMYRSGEYQTYTHTIIWRVIQQQLEEADGSTNMQHIRDRWSWSMLHRVPTASDIQSTYTVWTANGKPQLMIANSSASDTKYASIYTGIQSLDNDRGFPPLERVKAISNDITSTLIGGIVSEMVIMNTPNYSESQSDSDIIAECNLTGIDPALISTDIVLKGALARKRNMRTDVTISITAKNNPNYNSSYIVYGRPTTPPPLADTQA
jgi:hypothetical protein